MKNTTLSNTILPKRHTNFFMLNGKTIVEIISALFILIFFYTALNKTIDIRPTAVVIRKTISNHYNYQIAWAVVFVEYLTGFLLFKQKFRKIGLYLSTGLLISFSIYISFMMALVPHLPCSCGGIISKMNWGQHLIFNIVLILVGVVGIYLHNKPFNQHNSK